MRRCCARLAMACCSPKPGDPRLGSIIRPNSLEGDVVLLGYPLDEGTLRNGGRPGAKEGPAAFRRFLSGMGTVHNPEFNLSVSSLRIGDGGDAVGATLEEAHGDLQRKVESVLCAGGVPFVVGGSNDQSLASGKALLSFAKSRQRVPAIVNIDAHLDVRPNLEEFDPPRVHSGSPFRNLLQHHDFSGRNFVEFACQGSQCSSEHANFVRERGGQLMWLSKLQPSALGAFEGMLNQQKGAMMFVSFDVDAISGSDCPGVSCPSAVGLTAADALQIAQAAGRAPNVALFDLSEMNPLVESYRTPRLCVYIFYHFLLGMCQRMQRV